MVAKYSCGLLSECYGCFISCYHDVSLHAAPVHMHLSETQVDQPVCSSWEEETGKVAVGGQRTSQYWFI